MWMAMKQKNAVYGTRKKLKRYPFFATGKKDTSGTFHSLSKSLSKSS
jgi:hypothetical protein